MKRRYTETELIREIDITHKRIDALKQQLLGADFFDAASLRRSLSAGNTKLQKLKDALAEIRTQPLPGFERETETVNL